MALRLVYLTTPISIGYKASNGDLLLKWLYHSKPPLLI